MYEIKRRLEFAVLGIGGIVNELIQPSVEETRCKIKALEESDGRRRSLTDDVVNKIEYHKSILESLEFIRKGFRQSEMDINATMNNLEADRWIK